MQSSKKVWVIDTDPKPRRRAGRVPTSTTSRTTPTRVPAGDAPAHQGAAVRVGPLQRLAMTYLCGNLAPFLLQETKRSPVWAGIGAGAATIVLLQLTQWNTLYGWMAAGKLSFPWWFGVTLLVTLVGIVAGARAVLRAGQDHLFVPGLLPAWLRHPKVVGLFGFLLPGSGLLSMGHPWRAAWAWLNAGVTLVAAWILSTWSLLWTLNRFDEGGTLPVRAMEYVFVACVATLIVGGFCWFHHAFDGARYASPTRERVNTLGPWWVVPTFVVWTGLALNFDPAARAGDLDRLATALHEEGYTWMPYQIERGALRLDPSNVVYMVHASGFAEELGHTGPALALRARAEEQWELSTQVIDLTSSHVAEAPSRPPHPAAMPVFEPHTILFEDTQPALPELEGAGKAEAPETSGADATSAPRAADAAAVADSTASP